MKINTFATKRLTELITGCLTGDDIAAVANQSGYSSYHAIGMLYGNQPINTDKAKQFIVNAFKYAIKKANEQGKSLTRYVNDNDFCYYEEQKS